MAGKRTVAAALVLTGAVAAAVVAVLAARGGQSRGDDLQELKAYRLTMPKVRQMNEAYLTYFRSLQDDPRFVGLQAAREELRRLEGKTALTETDERRIEQLEAQIEQAEGVAAVELQDDQTLSEMAATIESEPRFRAAVRGAGLTAREFAMLQLSLFQALFAYGLTRADASVALPAEVPAENVAFVGEHEQELMAMARQWQALAGHPEPDTEPADEDDYDAEEP